MIEEPTCELCQRYVTGCGCGAPDSKGLHMDLPIDLLNFICGDIVEGTKLRQHHTLGHYVVTVLDVAPEAVADADADSYAMRYRVEGFVPDVGPDSGTLTDLLKGAEYDVTFGEACYPASVYPFTLVNEEEHTCS